MESEFTNTGTARHRNKKSMGFTIVEVVIAAAIMTMIAASALGIFIAARTSWARTSLKMAASREASMAISRIVFGVDENPGLRSASGISVDNTCAGVYHPWTPPTNYPPPAGAANHWVDPDYAGSDGSWRAVITNYDGRVTWLDYNINARNIVFWPDITDMTGATRTKIANYVTFASATVVNNGLDLSIRVVKQKGRFLVTNELSSFVTFRN